LLSREQLLESFARLNVWSRRGERAPHKPLLVLYALGRLSRGEPPEVSFRELTPALTGLLRDFGPPRRSQHPEYPFWRLRNDKVWQVEADSALEPRANNSDPKKSELLEHGARGRFTNGVLEALRNDPGLASDLARQLLDAHFPETLHGDIASAVGLALDQSPSRRRRDPGFRDRILVAYEFRCAVCSLDMRLGTSSLALEAAHIRWYQSGGPDEECNGLALCVLHHKVFDLGAFTVRPDLVLLVSDQVNGSTGLHESLLCFHGRAIREPQRPEHRPEKDHLAWHEREVFRGSPRHL
jgi:putative restriction endonuclease